MSADASPHFADCDDWPVDPIDPRRLPDDWTHEDIALLQAIDNATATPIYIEYKLGPGWAEGVHDVIDAIEDHLRERPLVTFELIEHCLRRLDHAAIDDSDGWTTQMCQRLVPLHGLAAKQAGISPDDLLTRRARLDRLDLAPFEYYEQLG